MELLRRVKSRVLREPVVALNLVSAVVALGVAFGLELSVEQKAAIIGLVASALTLVARHRVSPVG